MSGSLIMPSSSSSDGGGSASNSIGSNIFRYLLQKRAAWEHVVEHAILALEGKHP